MKKTAKEKIESLVATYKGDVFLREDFDRAAGVSKSQVTRCLSVLRQEGVIFRLGYGVYCRAMPSLLTGNLIPAKPFTPLIKEALERLGVEMTVTDCVADYNAGRTTQIPVGFPWRAEGGKRVIRKLGPHSTKPCWPPRS